MAQTLTTIDISKYQDPDKLDWQGLVDAGVKSVIIQLSHGKTQEQYAAEHIAKAKQYGLIWHGYHFYEGTTGEVEFSTSNAQALGLPANAYMFLDMEGSIGGSWSDQFEDFRTAWVAVDWNTGIYCSDSPYKADFDNDKLVSENVYRWIASYSYEPANYDIWQYTSTGGVGTYTSDLDHDYDKSGKLAIDYSASTGTGDTGTDTGGNTTTETGPYDPDTPTAGAYVGKGIDSSGLAGGTSYGYSTDGKNFYSVITPYGIIFRTVDGDRMWKLIEPRIKYPDTSTFITNDTMSAYVLSQLKNYATTDQIPDLTGYAKLTDIPTVDLSDYVKSEQLADYAKTTDIPDVSAFVTSTALAPYALKTDIPDVSAYITATALKPYATSDYVLTQLKSYALSSDIPDVSSFITATALTLYALKTDIPSLTDYAKLTDIPNLTGYATTTQLNDAIANVSTVKGDTGADGLSAYQVAVNAGFTGTVADWLASLKGDTGSAGKDAVDTLDDSQGTSIGSPQQFVALGAPKVYKQTRTLSATGISTSANYGFLITEVSKAVSGGVFQTFKVGINGLPYVYIRTSTSATAWSAWQQITTW